MSNYVQETYEQARLSHENAFERPVLKSSRCAALFANPKSAHWDPTIVSPRIKAQGMHCKHFMRKVASIVNPFILMTEARILAEVKHPNFQVPSDCKRREIQKDCFSVVEKLHDPLNKRIGQWRQEDKRLKRLPGRLGDWTGRKRAALFLDRLMAGYQFGSALEYLHRNRFAYRDLKLAFDMVSQRPRSESSNSALC